MITIKNPFKPKEFNEQIVEWDSVTKLENLKTLLQTLNCGVAFIYNEDDLIVGYRMMFGDDENHFTSDPIVFDWPMQHMPLPEAMQGALN